MSENGIRKLPASQLSLAMRLNVLTGCLATVWANVCSPQPIFNVFIQNQMDAPASTLGLLVGLLQLTGIFQLASIFIYGYAPKKKPFFVAAHLVHRILTLSMAAAAFVAAATGNRGWGIKLILIAIPLSWVTMNASSAGWWSWIADLFPEKIRGSFFLKRSSIINIVNVVWFFLASMLLDLFEGPAVYWVYGSLFLFGAISGIVDIVLNIFIPEPENINRPVFSPADAIAPLKNTNFVKFSIAVGVAIFSINLIAPFQAPFVVKPGGIGAPNTWLGIMFVISQLTWVIVAPFWGTVMDKWGRKPVVVLGCFYTLSWAGYFFLTSRSYVYLLPLISILGGLLAPAFWEGVNQMMLSLAPEKNRIAFVAWYMTLVGVVSAGGSIVGGLLFDLLAGFSFTIGPFILINFHIVQLISILMVIVSAFIISRVRESRERKIAFVVGRVANPGIIRTYAYMDDIATSTDPGRAEQALRSIEAETGDLALDEIIARLDDPYPELREEAARALGRIGSPLAVEELIGRLDDPCSTLRIAAARSLGKIGDQRAVVHLAEIVRQSNSEELLEAAIQALGDIGGDQASDVIIEFHRRAPTDRLRASAADAASRIGNFDAADDIFVRLLGSKQKASRKQYAIALGNLLGPPGDFYQYITGSDSGISERIDKLFRKLDGNIRARIRKRQPKTADNSEVQNPAAASATIKAIFDAFENNRESEALRKISSLAETLLADLYGIDIDSNGAVDFALRLDQQLGAFVWLSIELRHRLFNVDAAIKTDPSETESPRGEELVEVQRLIILLEVYFLSEM